MGFTFGTPAAAPPSSTGGGGGDTSSNNNGGSGDKSLITLPSYTTLFPRSEIQSRVEEALIIEKIAC